MPLGPLEIAHRPLRVTHAGQAGSDQHYRPVQIRAPLQDRRQPRQLLAVGELHLVDGEHEAGVTAQRRVDRRAEGLSQPDRRVVGRRFVP